MSILNTGALGSLNAYIDVNSIANQSAASIVLSGTWVGTVTFQGSSDGVTFFSINAMSMSGGIFVTTATANGTFGVNCMGLQALRVKMTSYTSGSATTEIFTSNPGGMTIGMNSIIGATNGTQIGNAEDRLKVQAIIDSTVPQRFAPSYKGTAVAFDDMNASTGGVARDTAIASTYVQLYSYTGLGNLFAFTISFEGNLIGADPFNIKLEIDGVTCFEVNTLNMGTATFWNLVSHGDENTMGLSVQNNTMRFVQRAGGLYFASSVKVYIKKAAGGSKRFRGGMIYLTKE